MNWRAVSFELTMLAMEACWLYALSSLAITLAVIESPGLAFPFLAILFLLLAAFYLARFLQHFDLPLATLRGIGVGLGGLCIFIILRVLFAGGAGLHGSLLIRGQLMAALIGVMLWWRGARLAQKEISFDSVLTSFRIGILALVFSVALEYILPGPRRAAGAALPFFAFGLLGLALGHWTRVGKDQPSMLQGRWFGILIATIVAVVVCGSLFPLLVSGEIGGVSLPALGGVGDFLNRAIVFIMRPFGYIAQLFHWLLSHIRFPEAMTEGAEAESSLEDLLKEARKYNKPLPAWVGQALKWTFIVLIAGWIARWLASTFGASFARGRQARGEVRESLFSKDALRQDLDSLVQGLLSRFRRGKGASLAPSFATLTGEALNNVRAIYRLYLDLLSLAISRGFKRKDWQTPIELQVGLENILPSLEVARITLAFTRARYGQYPPTNEELRELRQDWQRIQE